MNEKESKALSIIAERSKINLEKDASDKVAATLRGLLGGIPGVGGVLQEAVDVVIPNQRLDRVVLAMECFGEKVDYLGEEVLRQKILSEEFTDLLQDAIPQAARSLSEERREYIASFLKNSLTSEEFDHIYKKKLLSILGELNDAEIIFLRLASLYPNEKQEFVKRHEAVLAPIPAVIGSPQLVHDKHALRDSFHKKLLALDLLEKKFVRLQPGKMPEMDETTGMMKAQNPELTQLGRALLRFIAQPSSSDRGYDEFLAQKAKMAESKGA